MGRLLHLCPTKTNQRDWRNVSSVVRAVALSLLLLVLSHTRTCADEWTEWRGGSKQGRSASAVPLLHWSPTQNVVWKTALPGKGYSSPIVTNDSVYVSAAWSADSDIRMRLIVQGLLYTLLLLIAAPLCVMIFRRCRTSDALSLPELFRLSGYTVLTILLSLLIFYGESLLDFHRAVERGWIAACLCGVLSLRLSAFGAKPKSRTVLLAGVALTGFAVLLGATIPDPAHTVTADPHSDVSILIYLTIVLPLLVGLSLVIRAVGYKNVPAKKTDVLRTNNEEGVALHLVRALPVVLAIAVGFALFKLIWAQQSGTEATISVGVAYTPHLSVWSVGSSLFVLGLFLAWRGKRGSSAGNNVGIVVFGTVLVLTGGFCLVERLIVHSPYLAYLLGQPAISPLLGKKAVLIFAALCGLAVLGEMIRRRGKARWDTAALLIPFRTAASLLPVAYMGYALYLPKEPRLERGVLCVDRRTRAIRWKCGGLFAQGEIIHSDNSPATPTPATDGKRIYAWFGTPGLICVDTDGKRLWLNTELPYKTREGVASSPLLCQGNVIILSESDAGNSLAAIDCQTGKTAWHTVRRQKQHSFAGNCRTPNIVTIAGQEQIVVWGYEDVSGYDPKTGRELWSHPLKAEGMGDNPVASAVFEGDALYLVEPYRTSCLDLARLAGSGDPVRWMQKNDEGAQCSSPVIANGLLFAVSDNGSAYCLDTRTGKELWRKDLDQQHYASVIAVGNAVYFCSTQGVTTVAACDSTFRLLAQNDLGEPTFASMAPVDSSLFVRTRQNLYCLRAP